MLRNGFVYLDTIPFDIRYATYNNFVGHPLDGYKNNKCVVSYSLKKQLTLAQEKAQEQNLSLFIFESYRPLRAVENLVNWSFSADLSTKSRFYPGLNKFDLIKNKYIAIRSTHSRGAAVDVTLIRNDSTKELDMGTEFDFFGETSHTASLNINDQHHNNRQLLLSIMESSGFTNYDKEWWHFTLIDEPFPDQYFDFEIR